MAALRKPKPGRRASFDERRIASEWVNLYRAAQSAPDGRLCLNPDDEAEAQTWIDGNDPEHLLRMLEEFSRHGTFENVGDTADSIRLLPLRCDYRRARETGQSHQDAVEELAEKHHVSTRTIERYLRVHDNP